MGLEIINELAKAEVKEGLYDRSPETPREERPFHQLFWACDSCKERFRSGDQIYFRSKEPICRKCSENIAWRGRAKQVQGWIREQLKEFGLLRENDY